jgi:hypothetical protein
MRAGKQIKYFRDMATGLVTSPQDGVPREVALSDRASEVSAPQRAQSA